MVPAVLGLGLILGFFRVLRLLGRLKTLPDARQVLTRGVFVSSLVGVLAASFVALAYVIWSSTGNRLAFMVGILGIEVFSVCCFLCVRYLVRLRSMVSEQ
jgi:hypothetical protein